MELITDKRIMMKTRYIIIAVLTVLLAGCTENAEKGDFTPLDVIANEGAPVITAVYDVADTEQATPLTSGTPGQNVCIVGKNLNFLQSLKFNTVAVDLSSTYTMSTKAIVQIPTEFSHEAVNTIEYTTDKGTTSFAFPILLPSLVVSSLGCEFQAPGTDLTIYGENFDYYGFGEDDMPATVMIAGKEAPLTYVSPNAIRVKVPESTPDNSDVTVKWQDVYGEAQSVSLPFRPTTGMLITDLSKVLADKYVTVEEDADVTTTTSKLGASHLHFSGTMAAWSWIELNVEQTVPDIYDPSAISDYEFAYEVLTAKGNPLASSGYEFAWNKNWDASYQWTPGESFDTAGQWLTVRLPLSDVAPNGFGEVGDAMTFSIGFQPTEKYVADFRMGNFRIQKK